MNNNKRMKLSSPINYILLLSITLVAFVTYRDMLGYFFTGIDTLALIETSRIHSLKDVVKILTESMMSDTGFTEFLKYYRPLTMLSYGLDYSLWKLNPFGYQTTDLVLHLLVAIFVFLLVWSLTNGNQVKAWLSSIIFTTHPILVANVPAISRRADILATLFLLISLLLFFNYISSLSQKRVYLILSVLFCVLALGAKEITVILPMLIFAYSLLFLFSEETAFRNKLTKSVIVSLPYLIIAVIFHAWRIYILRGIGGKVNLSVGILESIPKRMTIIIDYAAGLLYSDVFLNLPFYHLPGKFERINSLAALLFFLIVVLFLYRKTIPILLVYNDNKLVAFSLIWLCLLLSLHLLTHTFDYRHMYMPVIPFSAILSTMLVESFQSIICIVIKRPFNSVYAVNRLRIIKIRIASFIIFIVTTGLSVTLFLYSPLIRTYSEWEDSGNILLRLLNQFSVISAHVPDNATIHLYNVPTDIATYDNEIPRAAYFSGLTIKAWLDLIYPNNHMKVFVRTLTKLSVYPKNFDLETTLERDKIFSITCRFNKKDIVYTWELPNPP